MHQHFAILAAGIGDLLSALVPVVIFIIWVIGQIANRTRAEPAKPVRRAEQRPAGDWNLDDDDDVIVAQPANVRPANAGPANAGPNAGPKKTVFDEIEQFLARARQAAQQAQGQQGGAPPRPAAGPVAAEPVVAELAEPRRTLAGGPVLSAGRLGTQERVAAEVARTTDTSDVTANIDRLGDAVEVADDVMEAHLKEVFDHRLGSLQAAASPSVASAAPKTRKAAKALPAPIGFAAMLANTGNVRNAIVMSEILQRPTDRW